MPRKARKKSPDAVYHIMCRSESEFLLFRDDYDKDYYLELLKRYTERNKCSIYAYCLMDNHLHFHLDPKGYDVSKFMQSLNTAYVRYYNRKYLRRGHVFQDRFESRILDSDEYNLTVLAYIHNNPQDIEGFRGREEEYKYSSYGIYLGIRKDFHQLIDMNFIMELLNIRDIQRFRERYFGLVSHQREMGSIKELKRKLSSAIEYTYFSGRKVVLRDMPPAKVISFITNKLMIEDIRSITGGSGKILREFRAFTAYILRTLCGLSYNEICSNIYNMTISGCARLCSRGYDLLSKEGSTYARIFDELFECRI